MKPVNDRKLEWRSTMTMITQTATAAASGAGSIVALAGIVARRLVQFARAVKNRRDAATLASFDERMLADIGLTRSDLRDALSEPLWRDPSAILVRRSVERRGARRRSAFGLPARVFDAPSVVPPPAGDAAPLTHVGVNGRYY
jgi:uncharacterized protein YjiS (DUF1127 family)